MALQSAKNVRTSAAFTSPRSRSTSLYREPTDHLDEYSLNARHRRAVRGRGHFPTEQAALKCLYLVTRSLDPSRRGRARWTMRWNPALNAFALTLEGRIVASHTN